MSGSGQQQRKSYVLVSSTDRRPGSRSTTDFLVQLPRPIEKVVKVDLVQAVMDYRVANVVAPSNVLTIEEGSVTVDDESGRPLFQDVTRTLSLEEGLYTRHELSVGLGNLLGEGYTVSVSADGVLSIEFLLPSEEPEGPNVQKRQLRVTSSGFRAVLGMTSSTMTPTFSASNGQYGTYKWRFPKPTTLSSNEPYLLVQSQKLGTDIQTTSGDRGFWRMLLNDSCCRPVASSCPARGYAAVCPGMQAQK